MELMLRTTLIAVAILLFTPVRAQTKVTWETLADVKFTDKYIEEEEAYYLYPHFGASVKALEGQEIYIEGHILPIDPKESIYILSKNPFACCFFCGQAGPESIVELKLKPGHPRFKMDEVIIIKGQFRLNKDDVYQCNYILEEAEVYEG